VIILDIKELISALNSQGPRLVKLEKAVEVIKGRMTLLKVAAIAGWALAGFLAWALWRSSQNFDHEREL